MFRELDGLAVELAAAERELVRRKAALCAAKRKYDNLRKARDMAVIAAIMENPEESNVSLAARFGFLSEGSIRKIRLNLTRQNKQPD